MGINKIIAREGMILTNGDVYGKSVSLGVNDNIENWYEITEKEYKIFSAEADTEKID